MHSGLDNAGKTTIVKKFNGEDIDVISPTVRSRGPGPELPLPPFHTLRQTLRLYVWDAGMLPVGERGSGRLGWGEGVGG